MDVRDKDVRGKASPGPSWAWMIGALVAAIAAATAIAYRMIYPFFHQHPH